MYHINIISYNIIITPTSSPYVAPVKDSENKLFMIAFTHSKCVILSTAINSVYDSSKNKYRLLDYRSMTNFASCITSQMLNVKKQPVTVTVSSIIAWWNRFINNWVIITWLLDQNSVQRYLTYLVVFKYLWNIIRCLISLIIALFTALVSNH